MVRQTAAVVLFEILGGILFLAVIAAAFFVWQVSRGPLELSAFRDDIENALTEARDGRRVTVERVRLVWSTQNRRMDIAAEDVVFYSAAGAPAALADRADILLDAPSLLFGDIEVAALRVRGGAIEVRQIDDTVWAIGGEPLPPIPEGTLPETPAEWVGLVNRVIVDALEGGADEISAIRLEEVGFEEMRIDFRLAGGSLLAGLDGVRGALRRQDSDISLSVAARGVGEGLPAGVALDLVSMDQFDTLEIDVAFAGWTLAELGARLGVGPQRLSGLPADVGFSFEASRANGLEQLGVELSAGNGAIAVAGRPVAVSQIDGSAAYDRQDDILRFDFTRIDAGIVRGAVTGELRDAIHAEGDRRLLVTSPDLRVDATPYFERAWRLRGVDLEADIRPDLHSLSLVRGRIGVGGAEIRASGELVRNLDPQPGELPFSARGVAEMSGRAGTRTVLDFWPETLGTGARQFVADNIEAGELTSASLQLDLEETSFTRGYLEREALGVDFAVRDARIRFLSDVAPVAEASMTGRLTGNSFSAELLRGTWSSWTLATATVAIPRFNPKGGDIDIVATGTGPVRDAVAQVFGSRLDLEARTGFDPDRLSGAGEMTFAMTRPALSDVSLDDMDITVQGRVRDGVLSGAAAGFDLTGTTARVDFDLDRLSISGFGELGPATVTFDWRDRFDDGDTPSELAVRSVVTPDILNRFGLLGRPYIVGEVPVELTCALSGETIETADIDLDLSAARIDLAEIGWLKPSGTEASAAIRYVREGNERLAAAQLTSETASLKGDMRLGPDGRLISVDLDRAYLAGRAEVAGEIHRGPDGGLAVSLRGPFLDVSSAIPDLGSLGGAGEMRMPVTLDAEVERLVLGEGLELSRARMAAISDAGGLRSFTATGQAGSASNLEASYTKLDGGEADISLASDNAGFVVTALLDTDVLQGGRLALNGRLREGDAASDFQIDITDARLRDAPFLTQILSLASLRGLADTLGGEGVLFSEISLPIQAAGGRYVVRGGRASGPALGLTVNGWIEPEAGGISVDGVLVPSFGVNSALGGIPIIGDLMVGREGEGVFSLTYAIRGTLSRAQVQVNPLSAVTPGVLRRIFENPADTQLPQSEAAPPGE